MVIDIIFIIFTLRFMFKNFFKSFPFASFIFLFMFICYIYLGTIIMSFDEYYSTNKYFKELLSLVRVGYLSLLISIVLGHFLIERKNIKALVIFQSRQSEYFAVNIIFLFVFFISISYLAFLSENPLKTMMSNPLEVAKIRSAATVELKYFSFFSNFLYFLLPIFFPLFFFLRKKIMAFFTLLVSVILQLSTGQKSPIFYLAILLLITLSLEFKKFNSKKSIALFILGFIFIFLISFSQNMHLLSGLDNESIELVFSGLFRRMFYGGVVPILQYIEYFSIHGFYGFSNLDVPSDQLVYSYFYPSTGIRGTVNTVSLADFYGRFGNILFSGFLFFLLSFFFVLLDIFIFNKIQKPVDAAIYSIFCMTSVKLIITDWYTILPQFFNLGLWLIGAITLFEFFVRNIIYKDKPDYYFYSKNKLYFYLSLIIFFYVTLGQVKGLLLA